jgi:hypothetical protein
MTVEPFDVADVLESRLLARGYEFSKEAQDTDGLHLVYRTPRGDRTSIRCASDKDGVVLSHFQKGSYNINKIDQINRAVDDITSGGKKGDIEMVLENIRDRIGSKPMIDGIHLQYQPHDETWALQVSHQRGTQADIFVNSPFSTPSGGIDVEADIYLEHNPHTSQKETRRGLSYPELEGTILHLCRLHPDEHRLFEDRTSSDLSGAQEKLLHLIHDDINQEGSENYTYSTRIPKRVDPRTLSKLEEEGYVVFKEDAFMAPEESRQPTPKKIKLTPDGFARCRQNRQASCGCDGDCSECECEDCTCQNSKQPLQSRYDYPAKSPHLP